MKQSSDRKYAANVSLP